MDESYTIQYEQFELNHWWFVTRREIIAQFMKRFCMTKKMDTRWLDVGCGTGVLLNSMSDLKNKMGIEVHQGSVAIAQGKGLNVKVANKDWDLKQFGQFDLISLCDVLEHIEDDREVVRKLHGALDANGTLLITVPALMTLWSEHDVINHHFRRYRAGMLRSLFSKEQWYIETITYFSSLLLPIIWLVRVTNNLRGKKGNSAGDLKMGPRWVDAILLAIFRFEKFLLRCTRLPIGSSLLLVARKR